MSSVLIEETAWIYDIILKSLCKVFLFFWLTKSYRFSKKEKKKKKGICVLDFDNQC